MATNAKMSIRTNLKAAAGELVGTTIFLLMTFLAGQQSATPASVNLNEQNTSITQIGGMNQIRVFYASLGFGMSLLVNVKIFARISGAHFNPAVTLAFVLLRATSPIRGAMYVLAQILGGLLAAGLAEALLPGKLGVQTTLTPGVTIAQGLFLEMFVTMQLVLAVLFLALEKNESTPLAPIGIGLALFIGELASIGWTGGSINPARSFGPAVVARSFVGYHWIYWLGPLLGGGLAALFYIGLRPACEDPARSERTLEGRAPPLHQKSKSEDIEATAEHHETVMARRA